MMALSMSGGCAQAQESRASAASSGAQLTDKIIFPQCVFHKASLSEAFEFLQVKSRDLDPAKKGVNFLAGDAVRNSPVKITMDCQDVPLSELLEYVAHLAGLDVVMHDSSDVKVTLSTKMKPPYATSAATQRQRDQVAVVLPQMRFEKASLREALEFVRVVSEKLKPGQPKMHILLDPALDAEKGLIVSDVLDVTVADALVYIASVADAEVICVKNAFYFQPAARPQGKLAEGSLPDLGTPGKAVLPQMTLHGATLDEAVSFLVSKSRNLDPEKKGVRILIDEDTRNSAGKITLDSHDVTLERALVQVATVAGVDIYQLHGAVRLRQTR